MKTAIIATYRKSGFVEENLKRLKDFEIIIAADEPEVELLEIIEKYNLKATISKERRGKWRALNDALAMANGDYILFLDSDTRIVDLDLPKEYDAVEIRKEINSSTLIEKLVNIDYFNMFITSKLASKLKSSLGLNGAAFWIKKDILLSMGGFRRRINEDTDLGLRLGLEGYRLGVGGRALTKSPSNLKEWFTQRERWALGGAEVFLENFKTIIKKPKLWIPSLFLLFPALIGFLINLFLPDNFVVKILYFTLPLMLFLPHKILVFALFAIFEWHVIRNLLAILISFLFWSVTVTYLSNKVEYKLEKKYFFIYFFFYSPLWTVVCVASLIKVLIFRILGKEIKLNDWLL